MADFNMLISDDDEYSKKSNSDDEKIVFKKVKIKRSLKKPSTINKNKKIGSSVSLLTSDEEEENSEFLNKSRQKIRTIELLTSDEESDDGASKILKVTSKNKKRKNLTENEQQQHQCKRIRNSPPDTKKLEISEIEDTDVSSVNSSTWNEAELLAEEAKIDNKAAANLIKLWKEGNTIPFIARYRKNIIGNMNPELIRNSKEIYDRICILKKRISTVIKNINQLGKLDERLQSRICAVRSLEEVELIYAPYKPDSRKTLVDRAKQNNLEEPALHLLNNTAMVYFNDYVNPKIKGIETGELVEDGIVRLIGAEISINLDLLIFLRELRNKTPFYLHSRKLITKTEKGKTVNEKIKKNEKFKFEQYFKFSQLVNSLKPHQILAINRGENLKYLSIKIESPKQFENEIFKFCERKWLNSTPYDTVRQRIINKGITEAYSKLNHLIGREIRAELKRKAQKESCKVFSDNLKQLLLTPPVKGKSILAIDPGFTNGCKIAVISSTGSLLANNIIYPHSKKYNNKGRDEENVIKDLLIKFRCNLIAIGNGTACRETEKWIETLINKNYFENLSIEYRIVDEDGASIYSCSAEALKEFGELDPNIISAVSLARRIQDPMAELVKIEPCHLGVGMYQMDLKKKQLDDALEEVVSECVSFVGIDLNTASQCLLKKIAGLSDNRATQIIDYRERNGPFTHRKQLLEIFGIGERTFEQCAGFLRVGPTDDRCDTNFYDKPFTTPLDATIIHPESYPIVRGLLKKFNLNEKKIGSNEFLIHFKELIQKYTVEDLSKEFNTNNETIALILDALGKKLNYDLRLMDGKKSALFKADVRSLKDLKVGKIVTGRVKNVTTFGAFIDLGIEIKGLVPAYRYNDDGIELHLGDVIKVKVIKIDSKLKRIQLKALEIIK